MQKIKVLLSAFAVVAIVSSALAYKKINNLGSGSVYCDSHCTIQAAFKIDPTGTNMYPCGLGVQAYIFSPNGDCIPTAIGAYFRTTIREVI